MNIKDDRNSPRVRDFLNEWASDVKKDHAHSLKVILEAVDFVIAEEENIRIWTRSNSAYFKASDGRMYLVGNGMCHVVVRLAAMNEVDNFVLDNMADGVKVYDSYLYHLTALYTTETQGRANWYPVTLHDQDGAELFDSTTCEQKWSHGDYAEARWKYIKEFQAWLKWKVEENETNA